MMGLGSLLQGVRFSKGLESLLRRVNSSKWAVILLKLVSYLTALLSVLALGFMSLLAARESLWLLLELLLILGTPFVAVTVLRRVINAPRPYELYGFYKTSPKKRCGRSFPSRHAFSAFAIGTVLCFGYPIHGALLLTASLVMCVGRVLLGIHFIRDVVAGAAIGVSSALLGVLIFYFV